MTLLVNDRGLIDRLIAERQATGADRYDEVWDGTYVMSPIADDEHQELIGHLTSVLTTVFGWSKLADVRPGVNISDRDEGWIHEYRVPDVAVRLKDGRAIKHETHWEGGPDLVIEVVSLGDAAREKLEFYASIGVREVLILDRDPWSLELYRLEGERLLPRGVARVGDAPVRSESLGMSFGLLAGTDRPRLALRHESTGSEWTF
jgi:hypothetical protein